MAATFAPGPVFLHLPHHQLDEVPWWLKAEMAELSIGDYWSDEDRVTYRYHEDLYPRFVEVLAKLNALHIYPGVEIREGGDA